MLSKTDLVPDLLGGDRLFIEFLPHVQGFLYTVAFTFQSSPTEELFLTHFYKWEAVREVE